MSATTISLAPLLERFFTQRLLQQRHVSPHTIRSYRDTFRLFLTLPISDCTHRLPTSRWRRSMPH
jgi:hypothetical protein